MRFIQKYNNKPTDGFTLVEMLVIAPIVILVIAGFIALIVTLTGDVLTASTRSKLAYDMNTAFSQLRKDVRRSTEFRQVSYTPPAPQGADYMDAQVAAFDTLAGSKSYPSAPPPFYRLGTIIILRTPTTTKNPLDSTRELVYSTSPNPAACGTPTESQNDLFMTDVVYYTKSQFPEPGYSIWRRVIFNPSQTPCPGQTPWQRSSCAPGITGAPCQVEDQNILSDVVSIGLYYPDYPDGTTGDDPSTHEFEGFLDCINPCSDPGNPGVYDLATLYDPNSPSDENARAFGLWLTTGKTTSGRDVFYQSSTYVSRP